jgi:hypothetical protein
MIDLLLDALCVVGIGSGLIALIAGFAYARQMHQNKEHRQ